MSCDYFRIVSEEKYTLRGHNWVHSARRLAIVYCYIEFKLCYHKKHILFSIRVKELFEPIVLKRKGMGFCSF